MHSLLGYFVCHKLGTSFCKMGSLDLYNRNNKIVPRMCLYFLMLVLNCYQNANISIKINFMINVGPRKKRPRVQESWGGCRSDHG